MTRKTKATTPAPTLQRKLFLGDNLKVLRSDIPDESVNLVYLDPPFNSAADYNVLFRDQGDQQDSAQIAVRHPQGRGQRQLRAKGPEDLGDREQEERDE